MREAPLPAAPTPKRDCPLCPRLVGFRTDNHRRYPAYHNGPVPAFGPLAGRLLIVGLAPGLHGANQTGRPFTGDYAGDLLYRTLLRFGFAEGRYAADPEDGLALVDCRLTNAVRCVPPENRPTAAETNTCRAFLSAEIAAMPNLRVVVALGGIAHQSILRALGLRVSVHKFRHGAMIDLPDGRTLADSYHCSRYNTNTGRLTPEMFESVFAAVRATLDAPGVRS